MANNTPNANATQRGGKVSFQEGLIILQERRQNGPHLDAIARAVKARGNQIQDNDKARQFWENVTDINKMKNRCSSYLKKALEPGSAASQSQHMNPIVTDILGGELRYVYKYKLLC